MFSYLLGMMAMTIYNQTYGTSGVLTVIEKYESIMNSTLSMSVMTAILTSIQTIAVGICLLLYFVDLSGKVTEKNFSIEQFFKSTLRCVTAYMFIINASTIVNYLIGIGGNALENSSSLVTGINFFVGDNKQYFINGISSMKLFEILGYIVSGLIPWLLSMIGEVILQIVLISRIVEISVMTMFAPMAIADIYREGTNSSGVTYMKKMLALGLQVSVIILINIATQAIIGAIIGLDAGTTFTSLLGTPSDVAGKMAFQQDNIVKFLDAVLNQGDMLKVLGIMLSRVGLVWNSMPFCEEITGAR